MVLLSRRRSRNYCFKIRGTSARRNWEMLVHILFILPHRSAIQNIVFQTFFVLELSMHTALHEVRNGIGEWIFRSIGKQLPFWSKSKRHRPSAICMYVFAMKFCCEIKFHLTRTTNQFINYINELLRRNDSITFDQLLFPCFLLNCLPLSWNKWHTDN